MAAILLYEIKRQPTAFDTRAIATSFHRSCPMVDEAQALTILERMEDEGSRLFHLELALGRGAIFVISCVGTEIMYGADGTTYDDIHPNSFLVEKKTSAKQDPNLSRRSRSSVKREPFKPPLVSRVFVMLWRDQCRPNYASGPGHLRICRLGSMRRVLQQILIGIRSCTALMITSIATLGMLTGLLERLRLLLHWFGHVQNPA